jgi:hypothetical protein
MIGYTVVKQESTTIPMSSKLLYTIGYEHLGSISTRQASARITFFGRVMAKNTIVLRANVKTLLILM